MKNNIASGQSSKKEHLENGAFTACNRKMSTGKSGFESFGWTAERYPESCCQKCLLRFREKQARIAKKTTV